MELRKIQLTGETTFIVSLPKKWVTKNNLVKGDIVAILEKEDELVIRPKSEKGYVTEIKIKPESDLELIKRLIITRYIQGYDGIFVTSKKHISQDFRKGLEGVPMFLIGLEPFGGSSNEITFRMLTKEKAEIIESVSRMHEISVTSLNELMDQIDLGKYEKDVLNGIIMRDNDVDKFYFLILRQLSSRSGREVIPLIQIIKSIERISDHVERIARLMIERGRINKKDVVQYKRLIELYNDAMLALRSENIHIANEVIKDVRRMREDDEILLDKLLQKKTGGSLLILESFKRIGEYISDIAEAVINLS